MEDGGVARYSYADWYNFGTALNGYGRAPKKLAALFRNKIGGLPPGAKIVDFGGGTGRMSAAILRHQPRAAITAFEPNRLMADVYRRDMGRHPQCTLIVGGFDGDVSCLDEASQDAIFSAGVFDHIGRPRAALMRLGRVLKPGGHIAFTFERKPGSSMAHEVRTAIYNRYSDDFMRGQTESAGFTILHQDNMFGYVRTTGFRRGQWPQLAHYGIIIAQKSGQAA